MFTATYNKTCRHCGSAFITDKPQTVLCSLVCQVWSKVEKRGPDECWPWTGGTSLGYGSVRIGGRNGEARMPHRIIAEWVYGEAALDGLEACHRCHNRICCNPAHLVPGTRRQNALMTYQGLEL